MNMNNTHHWGYIALAGLATSFCSCSVPETKQKPNIIILLTDDQGYGDLHCYGNPDLQTPNLDQMAAEGTRFTNFYAGAASSTPSRAALLTGRYAERSGLSSVVDDLSENGLKSSDYTIADYLKQNGYTTGIFGKWHLGCRPEHLPLKHGFTEFFGIPYSNDMWPFHPKPSHEYPALPLYDGEQIIEYNPEVNRMTARLTERAVKFIRNHKENPFFLYLPYTLPHVPLGASADFKGKTGKGLYADVIKEIDWSVGQIMQVLRENGLDKNTLVLFTSDNGPWLNYGNHSGSNGGLREGKGTTFEGGQRVPFIAWMPQHIPAGKVTDQFLSALDIAPTLLELTDSQMPRMNEFDGENVWPTLTGKEQASHRPFFFVNNGEVEAVRNGKWKYITAHQYRIVTTPGKDGLPGVQLNKGGETEAALYDLEKDPQEKNNLIEEHENIAREMAQMIENLFE